MKVLLKDIKKVVKNEQKSYEFTYDLYRVILSELKEHEGKKYHKRPLNAIRSKVELFLSIQGKELRWIDYDYCGSMCNIKLAIKDDDRSYSYLCHYGEQVIDIEKFEEYTKCWELDKNRALDCAQLLENTDTLKTIVKNYNKVIEAQEALKELHAYGTPADTVEYAIKGFVKKGQPYYVADKL